MAEVHVVMHVDTIRNWIRSAPAGRQHHRREETKKFLAGPSEFSALFSGSAHACLFSFSMHRDSRDRGNNTSSGPARTPTAQASANSVYGETLLSLARPSGQPPDQVVHLDLDLDRARAVVLYPIVVPALAQAVPFIFEVAPQGPRGQEGVVPAAADEGDPVGNGKSGCIIVAVLDSRGA